MRANHPAAPATDCTCTAASATAGADGDADGALSLGAVLAVDSLVAEAFVVEVSLVGVLDAPPLEEVADSDPAGVADDSPCAFDVPPQAARRADDSSAMPSAEREPRERVNVFMSARQGTALRAKCALSIRTHRHARCWLSS